MKTLRIAIIVALIVAMAATAAFAQKKMVTDTSYIDRAQKYIAWAKDVIEKMEQQLEEARKEQDLMKIECIEKRLVDIQKLLAEVGASYKKMREHSFNKRIAELRQEFDLVDQKRKIMEQLVKLVNSCMGKTFHDGFTDSVEEFFGYFSNDDPTFGDWEDYWPEPLPPVYEPRPASLAENE